MYTSSTSFVLVELKNTVLNYRNSLKISTVEISCLVTAHEGNETPQVNWMMSDALLPSLQRLYRERGENMKHNYTLSEELPELVQAKINAMNLSEVFQTYQNLHVDLL